LIEVHVQETACERQGYEDNHDAIDEVELAAAVLFACNSHAKEAGDTDPALSDDMEEGSVIRGRTKR